MKKLIIATLAIMLAFGMAMNAEAVALAPGSSGVATTGAVSPGAGDPILASIIGGAWVAPSGFVGGTYSTWVRRDVDGFLVFEYQITNSGSSLTSVKRATVFSFAGWMIDADNQGVGGGLQSALVMDRSSPFGISIGFDFVDGVGAATLNPGETSELLWVKTNARHFTSGGLSIINGGAVNVAAFQPTIPEPTSMMLFGTGLLGFMGRLRKRS